MNVKISSKQDLESQKPKKLTTKLYKDCTYNLAPSNGRLQKPDIAQESQYKHINSKASGVSNKNLVAKPTHWQYSMEHSFS